MTTFLLESGVVREDPRDDAMWHPIERHDDAKVAYDRMVSWASAASRGLYGPHGSRRLRVRLAGPVVRIEVSRG